MNASFEIRKSGKAYHANNMLPYLDNPAVATECVG